MLMAGAAIALATIAASPADALTFNLIDTGGAAIGSQVRSGFETAARFWSSVLTNDTTVTLDIGFRQLGAGLLGSTTSNRTTVSMAQGYNALAASSTSTLDVLAVAGLQSLSASGILPGNTAVIATTNAFDASGTIYVDGANRIDNDGGFNNSTLAMTSANAKALGLTTDLYGAPITDGIDGSIIFSSRQAFDFDPADGVDPAGFDFIGIAIHEIGHALGFVSGVDAYDEATGASGPAPGLLENFAVATTLDLFRYSAPGTLDWSTSDAAKYFSLDGGDTALFGDGYFSLGAYNGDTHQASHWLESPVGTPQLGILDPTSARGQIQAVTGLDLAAFDAIGWNLATDLLEHPDFRLSTAQVVAPGTVPEPANWMLMIAGFGAVGCAMRRGARDWGVASAG
jgi:hypothetical protein